MSKSVESSVENSQVISNDANIQLLQQQLLQQQLLLQNTQDQDDEIDLAELWRVIWAGKFTIIIISMIFAVASVFFALSKPDIYKASAILAPASTEGGAGGLSAMAGQLGGLASMAGINLGGGGVDKTALALEILKSRSFIEDFITKHDLLVPLMASKNWDMASDKLILDDELYDKTNNKWIREVKAPKRAEPSSWEAYKEFSELVVVAQDKTTSMINIDIEFYSPAIAKQWLTWLVQDINEFMRAQDQIEAKASIDYLTNQLVNIKVATMETVFYQLIEEQTKNMMLTMVKKEYVFKTIDPAQVPDTKDKPKRALIVVLGTMLGGILSVLVVLIRYFSKKDK
ncbi:LPS O-antigen length regulator [Colwellia sp. 75C3]|uniref:Wzz/FepE/Etk N-terminal domain-containing protein n=1 Tax=Colwellia sp. 75C3 TaxID=888425 RepID=UPI000C32A014|nr:Wzz/FepE/Etk N-terminal domain-containing protein [Colwellia sp. 75C3]PKG82227.1 LPS O-antigen length regulator [Colwellia sp. 75C3]